MDLLVEGLVDNDCHNGGDKLANDSGHGGAGDTHAGKGADAEDKAGVEDDVGHSACQLGHHAGNGMSCGLQYALKDQLHIDALTGETGHRQVFHTVLHDVGIVCHLTGIEGIDAKNAHQHKDGGGAERQKHAVASRPVGSGLILFPQRLGQHCIHAHTGSGTHGDHNGLDGEGQRYRRQCRLSQFGDKIAVYNIIKGLHQHGDNNGQGHGDQQPVDRQDPHLVFLYLVFHMRSFSNFLLYFRPIID